MKLIITENQFNKLITEYVNRDVTSLKNYLSQTEEEKKRYLAHDYPYFFDDFIYELDFDFEYPAEEYYNSDGELEQGDQLNGYDLMEWLDKNNQDLLDKYNDYLYTNITNSTLDIDPSEYPAWTYFDDKPKLIKNQWLIHFTNNSDDIVREGFKYGVDEMTKLGLTTHLGEFDKKYGGYNFAYKLSDFNRYGKAGYGSRGGEYKYGKEAVMFRASGIETYHYGDQEPQVIFYGNTAKNIIAVSPGENENWAIYNNKTGRIIIESDNLEKIAYWVDANYQQYRKTL